MKKILFGILVLAAILRFWNVGTIPAGLTQDEAALGYNAYSILKTGRDEYGKFLPIIFKSFGDFKPGLYVYLDVPFVAALGLNEVSTRLPSAVSGVLIVYLIYLVTKSFFPDHKRLPILTAFVAATNPWLIFLSRGAWEANISLTLTLAGIHFFQKALNKNKYFVLSATFFSLTMITYQGAKLSTGIVVAVLAIIYLKDILKFQKRYLFTGIAVGVIISLPIILSLFNGQTGRLNVFSIFSYPRSTEYTQTFLDEGKEKIGDINYYLFHSETLNFGRGILGRYFNHFSPRFLFFDGDYQNPGHSAPYQGMLLLGDILFLIIGFYIFAKNYKLNQKPSLFIILWLILSPLPAVLSRDQVQSVRALNMVAPLIIIVSLGLNNFINWVNSKKFSLPLYLFLVGVYIIGFVYFIDAYYVHVPAHNSNYWNYGYKEAVEIVYPMENKVRKITFEQSYAQPYIYFLYYTKYNPTNYQKQCNLANTMNTNDVGMVEMLDNISFSSIDWSILERQKGSLVVISGTTAIPESLHYNLVREIKYLNGRDMAFKIIEIQ